MWIFGYSSYDFLSDGRIVCTYRERGVQHVALLDPTTRRATRSRPAVRDLRPGGERLGAAGGPHRRRSDHADAGRLARSVDARGRGPARERRRGLRRRVPVRARADRVPDHERADGVRALLPPDEPDGRGPGRERPPLLVNVHGGPTSEADPELDLEIQFFTSRGFAYAEVNYRGSTGYGRGYRETPVRAVGRRRRGRRRGGRPAPGRSRSRRPRPSGRSPGGSAGGWTTLCALTFRDAFATGTSYFGVSDLEPFAETTHKFESKYLDLLVGPWPEAADLWAERSPVRHAELLSSPLLILQGDEDEVVPPSQAEVIVRALESRGLPYAYLLFEGEQHGFRKMESISRGLSAELDLLREDPWVRARRSPPAAGDREPAVRRGLTVGCVGDRSQAFACARGGAGGPVEDPTPRSREGRVASRGGWNLSRAP